MIRPHVDERYLARRNSIHRFNLRQIEKARFPRKCECAVCGEFFLCRNIDDYLRRQYYLGPDRRGIRHVCWGCDLTRKIKAASATLYHLVCAIPLAERDREEIYPTDFRHPRIPLWREEKMRLPGLGLRDYAEPARLRFKFGRYEPVIRQRAAGPAQYVLVHLIGLQDTRWSLYLASPRRQQVLKRVGRYYKNSCWFPDLGPRRRFDKAQALSWKKLRRWKAGDRPFNWDPNNDWLLEKQESRSMGGQVFIGYRGYWDKPFWLRSHKRHADLRETRKAFNDRYGSYWDSARDNAGRANLTKTFRALGSLNIPRETIEIRNNMLTNLENDFGYVGDQGEIA